MEENIRFSVVIIVYNQIKYISECVQSVLDQTYPAYEIIIVDDGSTDGSGEYVRSEAEKYPNLIKVITQENSGAFVARATGMKHVTGDYFIVIDSDDALRKDALEIVAGKLQHNDADLMLINFSKKFDYSTPAYDYMSAGVVADTKGYVDKKTYLKILALSDNLNSMFFKFWKTELIAKVDVDEYGVGLKSGEDRIHTLMLSDAAKSIMLVDEPLYYYRTNFDSATQTYNPQSIELTAKSYKVNSMYTYKWFEPEKAKLILEQFESRSYRHYYLKPFYACRNWNEAKAALKECLSDEYGYAVLQKEALKDKPQINKRLLKALLKRDYKSLHIYYLKFYMNRAFARLLQKNSE